MYEGGARRARGTRQVEGRVAARTGPRPDRVALWAVFMALFGVVIAIATANAATGGIAASGGTGGSGDGECDETKLELGDRYPLQLGMCGRDVLHLNYILKSKKWSKDFGDVPLTKEFVDLTEQVLGEFQSRKGLPETGVLNADTKSALIQSVDKSKATWYGPGFWGNKTACGQTLTKTTKGVAHRTLPCGTQILIRYKGKGVPAKVIDRGPFANGAYWDLTKFTAEKIGFAQLDKIRVACTKKRKSGGCG